MAIRTAAKAAKKLVTWGKRDKYGQRGQAGDLHFVVEKRFSTSGYTMKVWDANETTLMKGGFSKTRDYREAAEAIAKDRSRAPEFGWRPERW